MWRYLSLIGTIVLLTSAVVFALVQFAKAKGETSQGGLDPVEVQLVEDQLAARRLEASKKALQIRALKHDPEVIEKAVKEHLLKVGKNEVVIRLK